MARTQSDPINDYAAEVELAAALRRFQDAENDLRHVMRRSIDSGMPAVQVAKVVGVSRATLFRWLASDFK